MIRFAIITVSDTRTPADDAAGPRLVSLAGELGPVVERSLVTDDFERIRERLLELCKREDVDVILTTGGTGFGPRDNTPEATLSIIERAAPGLAEAMRRETAEATPFAMLSRAVCGIAARKLIINLPGSPKGVEECFAVIRPVLAHAVAMLRGEGHNEN